MSSAAVSLPVQDESQTDRRQSESDTTEQQTEILLSILYSASVSAFTVTVISIVNLPAKMESRSVFVKGIVRPEHHEFQMTKPVEGRNPRFNESFHFDSLRAEELSSKHLTLTVHKASNSRQVCELFVMLGTLKIQNGVTGHFKFPLTAGRRSKRVSPCSVSRSSCNGLYELYQ